MTSRSDSEIGIVYYTTTGRIDVVILHTVRLWRGVIIDRK
jgi:hypothetical protein